MRHAERARIAAQFRQALQHVGIRRMRQQRSQQGIFLRAGEIDFVDGAGLGLAVKIGAQTARATPVTASTVKTRSAGTRDQLDTDGCEMPMRRANSVTPPTARMAS